MYLASVYRQKANSILPSVVLVGSVDEGTFLLVFKEASGRRGKGISSVVLGEVSEALMTTLGFFLSKDERPLVQGFWLLMVNAFW